MHYQDELIGAIAEKYLAVAQRSSSVFVGCSGGPDSMALAYILHSLVQAKIGDDGMCMGLLHVNFALRGEESDGDQRLVERFGKEHGVEVRVLDVRRQNSTKRCAGEGIQEWARRIRRSWFCEVAKNERAIIALAHHQSDVAENVILRMARGSGVGQLAGMSEFDYPYWRPLLDVAKEKIVTFIGRQHIPHRHDSSNVKLDYSRNKVRLKILPELESLYPGATGRIAAMATEASEVTSYVKMSVLGQASEGDSAKIGVTSLSGEFLRRLPRGVAIELLSGLAKESCDDTLQLSRTQLYQAWDHIRGAVASRTREWSCELQPGRFLVLKDDTVTAGKSLEPPCQTRFRQHINYIVGWDCRLRLAAGASVQIEKAGGFIQFLNPSSKSRTIAISSARSQDTVLLQNRDGKSKKWRFGVLMKMWHAQGEAHPLISVDDQVVGLMDGDQLITAGVDGQKEVVSRLQELLMHVP